MNWIRFNGSLRRNRQSLNCPAVSQPLAGTPLVNTGIKNPCAFAVKPASLRPVARIWTNPAAL